MHRLIRRQPFARRCFSKLSQSDEAIRQMTMGCALDPANPVAPEVPILESIFDDQSLFQNDMDFLKEDVFPTPQTPFASSPQEIKGCLAHAISAMFTRNLLSQCRTKRSIPDSASLYFFPAWHPIAQYRKSRPALAITPKPGPDFNGNELPERPMQKPGSARRKPQIILKPLDMAVWRQAAGRRFRAALFDQFQKTPKPIDGLYVVMPRRLPTREEATDLIQKFTKFVAKANLDWASQPLKTGNMLGHLRHSTSRDHIEPPQMFTSKEMWRP